MNAITEWRTQNYVITKLPATKKVQVLVLDRNDTLVTKNASLFIPFEDGEESALRIQKFFD